MAESTAYARRGHSGAAKDTLLASGITSGATTLDADDLSTWTGTTTNGPARATITDGTNEEEIEFTGVSSNTLTGITRGVGGTVAQSWSSGVTVSHRSSVRDFDEANKLVNAILGISGLAAGDLLYLTAATTFARLAKGTARQALIMNAGATAPSWAASIHSLLAAKGSIVTASAENTPAELAAGTDFHRLRARAGATNGVEWAALASSTTVATSETTTSATYTDLATSGPAAATVTTGASALVLLGCSAKTSAGGSSALMSFAVSGATTVAASDTSGVYTDSTSQQSISRALVVTGLAPGSNTFTAKYRTVGGATGTFALRDLTVIPI